MSRHHLRAWRKGIVYAVELVARHVGVVEPNNGDRPEGVHADQVRVRDEVQGAFRRAPANGLGVSATGKSRRRRGPKQSRTPPDWAFCNHCDPPSVYRTAE